MPSRPTLPAALVAAAAVTAALGLTAAPATAGANCAATVGQPDGSPVVAGHPCWVDVTPYPFGVDGRPVDERTPQCAPLPLPASGSDGYSEPANTPDRCYLRVDALAFRAPNRGLALVEPMSSAPGARQVWLFNGSRWFPDPLFPGSKVCSGTRLLWAGKLDYWLIGGSLCRFDGVNFEWQPLKAPASATARSPLAASGAGTAPGTHVGVSFGGGVCLRWDDCTFVGTYGTMLHWDGQTLGDASTDPQASPWLQTAFTDAGAGLDPFGRPVAYAVGLSSTADPSAQGSSPLPPQPDGSPAPQVYASSGGRLAPLPFTPPEPASGAPRTDLVRVSPAGDGTAWYAGARSEFGRDQGQGLAPIGRIGADGSALACGGYDRLPALTSQSDGYSWIDLATLPGTDTAFAVGSARLSGTFSAGVMSVRCGTAPQFAQFIRPNPYYGHGSSERYIPASAIGITGAVAATAANDAWLGGDQARVAQPDASVPTNEPLKPHVYRFTDGLPPSAPLGDDLEPRPEQTQPDVPVYIPVPAPPPAPVESPPSPAIVFPKPPSYVQKVVLPPVDHVRVSRPRKLHGGRYALVFTFRVAAPVTIGVEGLKRGRVVTATGLHRFRRGRPGRLVLVLSPKRWPTKIRFYGPPATRQPHQAITQSRAEVPALHADLRPIVALG